MCMIFKYFKLKDEIKRYKALQSAIISCLDDNTLNKILRKCEGYTAYSIDNKQLNAKYKVKARQKDFLELQELCRAQLVLNQFELSTKNNSGDNNNANVKSTLNEEVKPVKESNKKEKKA